MMNMNNQNISDELLNSFVDNELESDEKSEIFNAIGRDEALKERVCALRGLKEMVQHTYHQPPAHRFSPIKKLPTWWPPDIQNLPSLAACMLLLLLGWGSGWLMSARSQPMSDPKLIPLFQATQSSDIAEKPNNIIVLVSSSNPVRLKTALDETESLLEADKRVHRQLKVEIIANAGGMDLLRSDVSPFAKRIALMHAKYPNLAYLACSQTISKLQKKGVIVHLLPHTGIASSAVEQINKRLLQGWDYVRV
jgi:intracellular sulfur oxidation DsrE/DsrF family protein